MKRIVMAALAAVLCCPSGDGIHAQDALGSTQGSLSGAVSGQTQSGINSQNNAVGNATLQNGNLNSQADVGSSTNLQGDGAQINSNLSSGANLQNGNLNSGANVQSGSSDLSAGANLQSQGNGTLNAGADANVQNGNTDLRAGGNAQVGQQSGNANYGYDSNGNVFSSPSGSQYVPGAALQPNFAPAYAGTSVQGYSATCCCQPSTVVGRRGIFRRWW